MTWLTVIGLGDVHAENCSFAQGVRYCGKYYSGGGVTSIEGSGSEATTLNAAPSDTSASISVPQITSSQNALQTATMETGASDKGFPIRVSPLSPVGCSDQY